jgi:protein tyrosine phosphatase (PTP) superfamily phosphohydrolase (DUF442 family)
MSEERLQEITQFVRLSDNVGTAGQPTEAQFAAIKEAGYRVVINLLPPEPNALPNERELIVAQGLEYIAIPVVWGTPTREDFTRFCAAMEAHTQDRVFVHCAANKRVSAFMYLYRVLHQGVPSEEALPAMHRIWTPNPTWQRFISEMLQADPSHEGS